MATATFITSDGVQHQVAVDQTSTILEAAEASGLMLLSRCRHGVCGTCRGRLAAGQVAAGGSVIKAGGLGQISICQSVAQADVTIQLPYADDRIGRLALPQRTAVVETLDRGPGGVVRMGLRLMDDPEHASRLVFIPGQYAYLTPPGQTKASAFSFATPPREDNTVAFFIKVVPGGSFSAYLEGPAGVGDVIGLRGPEGTFTLRDNGPRPRWFVCGGSGLAPMMSMLGRMADRGDTNQATLILGVARPDQVFATDELAALAAQLPALHTVISVDSTADLPWDGLVGNAVDAMRARFAELGDSAERPDIYLCGPPGLLAAARACAVANGVPNDQVYEESLG